MSRLQERIKAVTGEIEQYRFNEAADSVYHLLWNDFADWYLEASKRQVNTDMLIYGLETMLSLSHPFTPFVTEAIWQQLPWRGDMLITAPWPEAGKEDREAVSEFTELQTVITGIRGVVAELGIEQPPLYHQQEELLEQNGELITLLAPVSTCQSVSDGRGLPVPGTTVTCWLDVGEDSIEKYRDNLQKSLDETRQYIRGLEQKLNNSEFKHNAPKEVVKDTQQRCEDAKQRAQTLSEQLTQLGEAE
jgi:valyl-tRNA synthetase